MEKQAATNPINHYNVPPVGAGTTVTIGASSCSTNTNNLPPPTYDQATGNAVPHAAPNGWNIPGMGPTNTAYSIPTGPNTTIYTTYGASVPPSQPSGNPSQQRAFGQPPPVVIIQQHPLQALGPEPVYLTCPACHVQKLTRIEYEPSTRTHLMAALLCLFGLWCCVCLPYCAGSCMNTHHYCGNCDKFLGTYGNAL